jgi:hypothetical protein
MVHNSASILAECHSILEGVQKVSGRKAFSQGVFDESAHFIGSLWSISIQPQLAHIFVKGGDRSHDRARI